MLQFGSNHKVKRASLTQVTAQAYIDFLNQELVRHTRNRVDCIEEMSFAHGEIPTWPEYYKALYDLWDSARIRHEEDIEGIEKLIKKLKEVLKL